MSEFNDQSGNTNFTLFTGSLKPVSRITFVFLHCNVQDREDERESVCPESPLYASYTCYRYIELNPVRASMVESPSEYRWSSYQCNGLGVETDLCTPHPEYLRLGRSKEQRLQAYRNLFEAHVDNGLLEQIRASVNKGLALGNDRFKDEIESMYGRRIRPAKMGRPKESLI